MVVFLDDLEEVCHCQKTYNNNNKINDNNNNKNNGDDTDLHSRVSDWTRWGLTLCRFEEVQKRPF